MADVLETIEDGVAILTLNRPDRLNAFSPEMLATLHEALPRLGSDDQVGAIVITGSGRGFTAGGDVKTMAARAQGQTFEQRLEGYRSMHRIPLMMRNLPKVIIGMVNGPAVGAGLGLALACDLRIAGRSARFATGFANVGYSGDFGGSWLLTRLVGTAKARELYFLNEMLDAEQAAALGIVNRVVDDAALRDEALTLARRIADGPRIALGYMKRNLHAAERIAVRIHHPPRDLAGMDEPQHEAGARFAVAERNDLRQVSEVLRPVNSAAIALLRRPQIVFAGGESVEAEPAGIVGASGRPHTWRSLESQRHDRFVNWLVARRVDDRTRDHTAPGRLAPRHGRECEHPYQNCELTDRTHGLTDAASPRAGFAHNPFCSKIVAESKNNERDNA